MEIAVKNGALERYRERDRCIEQVTERLGPLAAGALPRAVLTVRAVRRKRLGRTDERGGETGFADQVLKPAQMTERSGTLMRQMVHPPHIVHRVEYRSGRDPCAAGLAQGAGEHTSGKRSLGRGGVEEKIGLIGGRLVRDVVRNQDAVDVAFDQMAACLGGKAWHELRQPLTSIMNFTGGLAMYLRQMKQSDKTIEQTTDAIVSEAERASQIVEKVRRYAKRNRSERRVELAVKLVEEGINAFKRTTASEGTVISLWSDKELQVYADSLEMQLVVLNLLKNAAETVKETPKRIDVTVGLKDGLVCIAVRDYGPPISQEIMAQLANPTVSAKEDGLGLGLSLVKAVVERHDGHLAFNQEESGLTACVLLPVYRVEKK